MLAGYEKREYEDNLKVWVGRYQNSFNLPHWHNDCEIFHIEKGLIAVHIEGKEYRLTAGDTMYIASGQPHYMKALSETILTIMIYDPSVENFLGDRSLAEPKLKSDYSILSIYRKIHSEIKEKAPLYQLSVELELQRLLLEIFRSEKTVTKKEITQNSRFRELLTDIDEKYAYYTFSDAAKFMGFSEPYFSKYFTKMTGINFAYYLNSVRIEKAICFMRKEDHPKITEISSLCGFDTIRNFNRVFKTVTGYSPSTLPDHVDSVLPFSRSSNEFNPTVTSTILLDD